MKLLVQSDGPSGGHEGEVILLESFEPGVQYLLDHIGLLLMLFIISFLACVVLISASNFKMQLGYDYPCHSKEPILFRKTHSIC